MRKGTPVAILVLGIGRGNAAVKAVKDRGVKVPKLLIMVVTMSVR